MTGATHAWHDILKVTGHSTELIREISVHQLTMFPLIKSWFIRLNLDPPDICPLIYVRQKRSMSLRISWKASRKNARCKHARLRCSLPTCTCTHGISSIMEPPPPDPHSPHFQHWYRFGIRGVLGHTSRSTICHRQASIWSLYLTLGLLCWI